ncbi:Twin-arginine translocation protein TatB [alpha proteobacterium BAL199]|jgi:sec-independent protein translocase protein TatB|nr:Twin-arginine translocation protein TatB [alpha proteobacterium BAL199]
MFDIGWQEFILVALVAVVVVGPKDLPRVIRSVGQWIRKARSLASEFQGSLEEMARESELDDVRREIQKVSSGGIGASIEKHIDPDGDIRKSVESAKASSGVDEIKGTLDEAHQDVRSLAQAGDATAKSGKDPVQDYASLAASSMAPGNSVTPPAPAAPKSADPAPTAAKAPAKKAASKRPAKAVAATDASSKPPAKPRRATKKPTATDTKKA